MSVPVVSIMTPVRGASPYLEETLTSLLSQTLQDFEWIVIDGGLKEPGKSLLEDVSARDKRIKVFEQTTPGLSEARNQAMALASGTYCAVADGDDVSLPLRLKKEVAFLVTHPEIGLCGSWLKTFGAGRDEIRKTPLEDAAIRSLMIFACPFAHSTVMWKRELVERTGLRYRLGSAEDYDLWVRLAPFVRFANIPEVLVGYRIHSDQHSQYAERSGLFDRSAIQIWVPQIKALGIEPTEMEIETHRKLSTGRYGQETEAFVRNAEAWLLRLRTANQQGKRYPELEFNQTLAEYWWYVCSGVVAAPNLSIQFLLSPLNRSGYAGMLRVAKLGYRFARRVLYSSR